MLTDLSVSDSAAHPSPLTRLSSVKPNGFNMDAPSGTVTQRLLTWVEPHNPPQCICKHCESAVWINTEHLTQTRGIQIALIFWHKTSLCWETQIHPSIHPSVSLFVYPSVCPSIYLSICPSIHPFIHLSIHLSVCPSFYLCLSIHPFIHPSVCLSVYLSICASIYLSNNLKVLASI